MEDVKQLMKENYLKYASYVILERAIPNVDGLKPVQRRILHTLWLMDDGKLHKVANVAGQTMALHPHGDAAITDALVTMANKGYLLDTQGNFGNILTGDPAAASRYIETRLSPLAKETLFNPDLTETTPSYDGRKNEPLMLPSKIPLLLLQGIDGIAVGMATHILPHNFVEVLEAEIALIEGNPFTLLPDFPTGGIMDASNYDKGKGKIKLRAKVEIRDPKTLVITEICYGTTTESLIRSIDEVAKKGKIKIDSIHDYTADKVEIEIKLPRGQYAQELIDALYAYTECGVTLTSQVIVIKDGYPWETDVDEILKLHAEKLQEYLRTELHIERDRLLEKIFEKSLEQIFIEYRLYKLIETCETYDEIHRVIEKSLIPFHPQLSREPTKEDREKLLVIPIRRISRFDFERNQEEIVAMQAEVSRIDKELKNIKKVAVRYLRSLIHKYGKEYPRKTSVETIEAVDLRAIETRKVKVGFDPKTGFIGTKISSDQAIECTNFDKLLLMFKDGSYKVINISEKQYVQNQDNKIVYAGVADKKTILNVAYRDPKTHYCYAKRFIVTQFLVDKLYRFIEEEATLEFISAQNDRIVELQFVPKIGQRVSKAEFSFNNVLVKGVAAKGILMARRPVKKVIYPKKDQWFVYGV